jgi:hypothetical protein
MAYCSLRFLFNSIAKCFVLLQPQADKVILTVYVPKLLDTYVQNHYLGIR